MNGLPLDHVGVAVPSIQESAATYESNIAFVGSIELIEPRSSTSPVGRFLKSRGPGVHHVAYRVSDLRATLQDLNTRGFQLIDEEPRLGARGHLVAFVHPKSTGGTLIELVQHGP